MQIPINKDIEEAYQNEFWKGFTLRQVLFLALSALIIVGITVLVWWRTGLAPDVCVYIGIPFGIPTLLAGFWKIQDLTFTAYVKEIIYAKRTRILTYDAGELPGDNRVFTMDGRGTKKRGWLK